MIARAVTSWLPFDEEAPLVKFVYTVTEPIILPVRNLLERNDKIASMPFDISFMVAYLLLIIVQFILPTVSL